jgi:hypothetical protein
VTHISTILQEKKLIYMRSLISIYMRVEIEERKDGSWLVSVDNQDSVYHGDTVVLDSLTLISMLEELFVYDM